MRPILEAARAAAADLNPSSDAGQDLAVELCDLLDQARDKLARIENEEFAQACRDSRVEGFLARNDAMWGAA